MSPSEISETVPTDDKMLFILDEMDRMKYVPEFQGSLILLSLYYLPYYHRDEFKNVFTGKLEDFKLLLNGFQKCLKLPLHNFIPNLTYSGHVCFHGDGIFFIVRFTCLHRNVFRCQTFRRLIKRAQSEVERVQEDQRALF